MLKYIYYYVYVDVCKVYTTTKPVMKNAHKPVVRATGVIQ